MTISLHLPTPPKEDERDGNEHRTHSARNPPLRGESLTEEEYQGIVEELESMDPNFFAGYPSDHAGPLTPQEKRDAVRDGFQVWASDN